ncbi:DNA-binding response OmpR family regulator [Tenacibaculum adriaticum]|uniref:dolichyl-phosphate beta-glucosyltransferase n=1 Tax=Tenacibaculum adriaticum TaxID=413713 RepID=A0A5S5DPV1_9FLAO|nr:response regulator [Tenacibaculum adriaticum]TYP96719.1 DNA-binding response OmpR family regulator [Tenacibaculum adriaticum]
MKILAIDDQQLILLSLEKRLVDLGYEVKTANTGEYGIELFNSFNPDLVIVDINMPEMSGLEVLKYIQNTNNSNVKIMVMSGNTDEDVIVQGFELGIDDYMKKPVSLNEVAARVKKLIGVGTITKKDVDVNNEANRVIREKCIGVVIPCYNEEDRLLSEKFTKFVHNNLGYHLCFVNDGSTDNTLEVLENLSKDKEDYISVYNCDKNGGKAEAVRLGILHLAKNPQLDYIGFLDADLSTDFKDFDDLVKTIESTDYKIVSGSRISRMGANITKESARQIISLTINFIIQKILGMNFKDTQCGAKIMDREIINNMFQEKFITRWLFDVEIFMRMKNFYGEKAKQMICEQPLKRWIHADGSKLSMKDSFKILGQLVQIARYYK